jgi:hypothetical protein
MIGLVPLDFGLKVRHHQLLFVLLEVAQACVIASPRVRGGLLLVLPFEALDGDARIFPRLVELNLFEVVLLPAGEGGFLFADAPLMCRLYI